MWPRRIFNSQVGLFHKYISIHTLLVRVQQILGLRGSSSHHMHFISNTRCYCTVVMLPTGHDGARTKDLLGAAPAGDAGQDARVTLALETESEGMRDYEDSSAGGTGEMEEHSTDSVEEGGEEEEMAVSIIGKRKRQALPRPSAHHPVPEVETLEKDPVCGGKGIIRTRGAQVLAALNLQLLPRSQSAYGLRIPPKQKTPKE